MGARLAGERQDARRPADELIELHRRPLIARAVIGAGRGTWWTMRYAVFLPLLFVRAPLMFILGWFATAAFIGLVLAFAFYVGPHRAYVLLGMLGVGLVATAARHSAYDAVLRWIEPKRDRP